MADAMNRSVLNIMIGGFGGGEGTVGAAGVRGSVREIGIDDAAIQLAYAQLGHRRPGLRPGGRPGTARASASSPSSSRRAVST